MKHSIEAAREVDMIAKDFVDSYKYRVKHRHGTIEEWEIIAKECLADPRASRSECLSALIGITRSKDEWLKEHLAQKMKTAWKADLNVLNKLDTDVPEEIS